MARERHVFPTGEIPHLWAHQSQGDARNPQGNLYFTGATIYSYRDSWPLARIYCKGRPTSGGRQGAPDDYARDCVLVLTNSERASVTTAQHQSEINGAVRHLASVAVPYVENKYAYGNNRDAGLSDDEHARNLAHLVNVAAEALAKAKRAMIARNVEWERGRAAKALEDAGRYLKFFGIRRKAPAFPAAEWEAAAERAQRIENPDPVRDAKRIKARASRQASQQRALKSAFDTYCAQVAAYNSAYRAARVGMPDAAAHWRETGQWLNEPAVDIPKPWIGAQKVRRQFHAAGFEVPEILTVTRGAGVLLRLDGDQIVTSMGARIPADHAPRIWALVQACRSTGREYHRNGHTEHAGTYAIDCVTPDGEMRAGCHTIAYAELERLAQRMGLV